MARLTEPQKRFIVRRIAHFVSLKQIRAEFKAEFGSELSEEQASAYNPETVRGQADLSQDLKNLFQQERDRYVTEIESVPVHHHAYRMRQRQEQLQQLQEQLAAMNPKMTGTILDIQKRIEYCITQAAKESGGLFERPKQSLDTGQQGALDQLREFLTAPLREGG